VFHHDIQGQSLRMPVTLYACHKAAVRDRASNPSFDSLFSVALDLLRLLVTSDAAASIVLGRGINSPHATRTASARWQ